MSETKQKIVQYKIREVTQYLLLPYLEHRNRYQWQPTVLLPYLGRRDLRRYGRLGDVHVEARLARSDHPIETLRDYGKMQRMILVKIFPFIPRILVLR